MEGLIAGFIILSVLVAVVLRLLPTRRPPTPVFQCARCRKASRHSARTEQAWREGKTRFFCADCHQHWRASQPAGAPERTARARGSGCLGVFGMLALPVGAAALGYLLH